MSSKIIRGQKTDLTKTNPDLSEIIVGIGWLIKKEGVEIDATAFMLQANDKCRGDQDVVFYGNPSGLSGAVDLSEGNPPDKAQIKINLKSIPPEIQKIAFTLTIHEGSQRSHFFGHVPETFLRITNTANQELIRFNMGRDFNNETAIVIAELYRHKGEWKINPIAMGYDGGLKALCDSFGIVVKPESPEIETSKKEVKITTKSEPATQKKEIKTPIKQDTKINISKITLKKQERATIKKTDEVVASLEWESNKDLDLYCLYITNDDKQGKIYYRNLGDINKPPYIALNGDSKASGSETIHIVRTDNLKYALIAAYSALSNGIGSFKSMKAKAVVTNNAGQTVVTPLLEENKYAYWVAIALIDFTDSHDLIIKHVETYSGRHKENSPVLYVNGSFKMDIGPIEFKNRFMNLIFGSK